jgi:hypothetical protein
MSVKSQLVYGSRSAMIVMWLVGLVCGALLAGSVFLAVESIGTSGEIAGAQDVRSELPANLRPQDRADVIPAKDFDSSASTAAGSTASAAIDDNLSTDQLQAINDKRDNPPRLRGTQEERLRR